MKLKKRLKRIERQLDRLERMLRKVGRRLGLWGPIDIQYLQATMDDVVRATVIKEYGEGSDLFKQLFGEAQEDSDDASVPARPPGVRGSRVTA